MSQKDLSDLQAGRLVTAPGGESELQLIACWNDSGAYGDGSCAELQRFVHCRNCPVYSAAGARLLDRPLPENYRQEWTQHFAEEKSMPEVGNESVVLFRIQSEWLALPTHTFQEIAEKRPIHSLPNRAGEVVLGLANVRGELVTCISIGHLLQIEGVPSPGTVRADYRRLLVLQWEGSKLAFPVDEVQGPHRFHTQDLKSPPSSGPRGSPRYAQAVLPWQERAAGLLDAGLLLSSLNRCLA